MNALKKAIAHLVIVVGFTALFLVHFWIAFMILSVWK